MTTPNEIKAAETVHGSALVSITGVPTMMIRIEGDVDLANACELENRVGAAYQPIVYQVLVDLIGTTYLDSAGLSMLGRLSSRLTAGRTAMTVVAPPASAAHRVICLSGLADEFSLQDSWPQP